MKDLKSELLAGDFNESLSPEADSLLAVACAEFNTKQAELKSIWRLDEYKRWGFSQDDGLIKLEFKDGAQLIADGQILGSYAKSDKSWEWAWNNPNVSDNVKGDSLAVKKLGDELNISYLVSGTTTVPSDVFISYLCAIGLKATGSIGIFRGSAGAIDIFISLKNPRWRE